MILKNKKLLSLVIAAIVLFAFAYILQTKNIGTAAIWNLSQQGKWLLPLVVISSLIDSINPCAFSVLLLTIAFLFSIGQARKGILLIGGFYILGILVIYILIGLGILQAFHLFNTPHFMAKVGASLLVLLGLINLIGRFFPKFPIRFRIPTIAHRKMAELMEKSSLTAAFSLGALVGLCEFPCTGGPYLMILGLLHDKITYLSGLAYLILYNFIFISPLVLILLIASNENFYAKVKFWKKENSASFDLASSLGMVILGVVIFLM